MKKIVSIALISALILTSCGQTAEIKVEKNASKNVTSDVIKKSYFAEDVKLI
jgi:PBP1b-binding outer membrane lipoprotein LpoB